MVNSRFTRFWTVYIATVIIIAIYMGMKFNGIVFPCFVVITAGVEMAIVFLCASDTYTKRHKMFVGSIAVMMIFFAAFVLLYALPTAVTYMTWKAIAFIAFAGFLGAVVLNKMKDMT